MTTIRQIDRLWSGNDHRRLIGEIAAGRPELMAVAERLLGPAAAAAVAIIRLEELGQSHQQIAGRMIRFLLSEQLEDGGWGELAVTVLAIRALRCSQGAGPAVDLAIEHLNAVQREEGAWPFEAVRRLPADPLTTAFVLVNLGGDADLSERIDFERAAVWLRDHRDEMDTQTRRLADRAISPRGPGPNACAIQYCRVVVGRITRDCGRLPGAAIIGAVSESTPFVSRGGIKLEHALSVFGAAVANLVCADLGCSTGGFTDCLLRRGAARIYAVDTGYGVLDWKLRNDARVSVMERTNAMHVVLPEAVDLVVIDAGWTRQRKLLPHASTLLKQGGSIVTLIKPHYESEPAQLRRGVLPEDSMAAVLDACAAT